MIILSFFVFTRTLYSACINIIVSWKNLKHIASMIYLNFYYMNSLYALNINTSRHDASAFYNYLILRSVLIHFVNCANDGSKHWKLWTKKSYKNKVNRRIKIIEYVVVTVYAPKHRQKQHITWRYVEMNITSCWR